MATERASSTLVWSQTDLALLLGAAASGIALYALMLASDDPGWMGATNASLPAALGAACLWIGYRMVRNRPAALWSPLPWFLVASTQRAAMTRTRMFLMSTHRA